MSHGIISFHLREYMDILYKIKHAILPYLCLRVLAHSEEELGGSSLSSSTWKQKIQPHTLLLAVIRLLPGTSHHICGFGGRRQLRSYGTHLTRTIRMRFIVTYMKNDDGTKTVSWNSFWTEFDINIQGEKGGHNSWGEKLKYQHHQIKGKINHDQRQLKAQSTKSRANSGRKFSGNTLLQVKPVIKNI